MLPPFAAFDIYERRIPHEATILDFRHLLEEHEISEQILDRVNQRPSK